MQVANNSNLVVSEQNILLKETKLLFISANVFKSDDKLM